MDITLNGSGDINYDDLSTGKLSLDLNGSGKIAIDQLTATTSDASVNGSGDVRLAGKADSQTVSFHGSGNYLAGDLETGSAEIEHPWFSKCYRLGQR